ncbi:polymeric immunoglobulin receptor-like, partial [Pseudorasbora parva]|uniref:polymeric immunoglobulin receptor-like n=1 Tax=Pseudorasbora parva TaxID=51549 RepID=UPI00351E22D4
MDLLTFIFVAAVAVISDGFTVRGPSGPLVAPLGSSVVLSCYVDKPLPMEGLEVEWRRTDSETESETVVHLFLDGESRPESQHQDYHDRAHFFTDQIQHGNFSLRLDNLRAEDEGKYTCKVYSEQDSGETEVQIKDIERLLVLGSSRSISASVGEDVTLNCSVDSHITPEHIEELSWEKTDEDEVILVLLYQNNKTLPEAAHERYRDRVEFFTDEIPKGNFSLRLKSVRTEDKGVYMCQVFAGGLSANATVVLEQLGLTVRGPSAPLVAPLGSSVVLSCYVDKPLPMEGLEVEWRRTDSDADSETVVHLFLDGESRPETQHQDYHDRAHFFTDQIQHGNFSLRLDNLRAKDEGKYTCKVYSTQDSGETEVQIKDVERLLVSGSSRSISASVGEDVTLNCSVDSHITPEHIEELSWKKTDEDEDILVLLYQNDEVSSDAEQYRDRVEFFTDEIPKGNFSLRLKSVRTEDKGVYMCQVFAGDLSANATVVLEQLGFSALHIMVLILCISASGSALLLCCLIYCRSPDKGLIVQTCKSKVHLGSAVVLPCRVPPNLLTEDLKVEWRRTRRISTTLVHLYQDGESRPEKQHKDYHDRAHFFTDLIKHGNFSLRLDNLRAEDEGEYTCKVYSKRSCVFSAKTNLVLRFFMTGEVVPLGGSAVLPCKVRKNLFQKILKVEWRKITRDSETQILLYEDGEIQRQKDYRDRAHFITKKISDGNFSLRLEKLRAEDEGEYTCRVYTDQNREHSTNTELKLGFIVKRHHTLVPLGSSVLLPCYTDEPSPLEGLEVEWGTKGEAL